MTLLAILADDLTGAADAGCAFANAGLTTTISFEGTPGSTSDVVALSTSSRGLSAAEAANANSAAVHLVRNLQPHYVYKKIDSALRGHPCAELVTIMDELGERRALVAPALPAEGRVTLGSRQFAGDMPIDQTDVGASSGTSALTSIFSCGHFKPIHTIGIDEVRRGPEHLARVMAELREGIVIVDAESDANLNAIARAGIECGISLMAGSAGLANQLATILPAPGILQVRQPSLRPNQPVLIVAGSQHPATASQVSELGREGVPIVRPFQPAPAAGESPRDATIDTLRHHLGANGAAVLATVGVDLSALGAGGVVDLLASTVAPLVAGGDIGGLVLTGGDVAAGIAKTLGARQLELKAEVLPAIPWGFFRIGADDLLPVITKAGSFGNPRALVECLRFLRGS